MGKLVLLSLYKPLTGYVVFKTGLSNIYRLSNSFAVVKTILLSTTDLQTGSAVVQTCMAILHRHSTGFAVVKTGLLNLCNPHGSQNWLAAILQALNRHCRSQNRYDNPVQAFNQPCVSKVKAGRTQSLLLSWHVSLQSRWACWTSTGNAVVKTGWPSSSFRVVKTGLSNL